ncbi:MAG: biotin--[acetyl-CoA-carboxylase] ligase [Asticcacaulis sp.]
MVDHPAITPVEAFECLESTQTEALSRLKSGDAGPRWIRALRQTAGQGRMGRVWRGEDGNLFASWYMTVDMDLRLMPQLAFVAALAVHDVLRSVVRDEALLKIKWPNDVLYDGAKLCGILVQSEPFAGGLTGLVTGIGINVQVAPEVEAYRTASLRDISDSPPTADELMSRLNNCFRLRFAEWRDGKFADMATEWFARAYGRDLVCVVDQGRLEGRIAGLNTDGALLIRPETGAIQAVSSGTIRYREVSCS